MEMIRPLGDYIFTSIPEQHHIDAAGMLQRYLVKKGNQTSHFGFEQDYTTYSMPKALCGPSGIYRAEYHAGKGIDKLVVKRSSITNGAEELTYARTDTEQKADLYSLRWNSDDRIQLEADKETRIRVAANCFNPECLVNLPAGEYDGKTLYHKVASYDLRTLAAHEASSPQIKVQAAELAQSFTDRRASVLLDELKTEIERSTFWYRARNLGRSMLK